jgi:uncharacterized protein
LQPDAKRAELAPATRDKIRDAAACGHSGGNRPMKPRFIPLLAALACGTLLAMGAHAQSTEQPRTIAVNGLGEVRAEPDMATVVLGAEARRPELNQARAEVAKTIDAILKLTRELKIEPQDVQATRINVQPEYNWNQNARERNLIGYYVSRQVEIELRDLDKLGQLLERATDLGVNQLGDPRLDSSKRKDLVREALAKAIVDARQSAEVAAKAAGVQLGAPRMVTANTESHPPPIPMMRGAFATDAVQEKAADTYQSGEMTFTATVHMQYDMVP